MQRRTEAEQEFQNTVLVEFFSDIKRIGWFTRLDFAVDDVGGSFFSVEDFRSFLEKCEVVSKWRKNAQFFTDGIATSFALRAVIPSQLFL